MTEAGFGADLGGEKFLDIKCRSAGLKPSCAVVVATVRALKMHGGVARNALGPENVEAVKRGIANLQRHVENLQKFGLPVVVAVNHFTSDTEAEFAAIKDAMASIGTEAISCTHWAHGGAGAEALARAVVSRIEAGKAAYKPLYPLEMKLADKIRTIAKEIYRASDIAVPDAVAKKTGRVRGGRIRRCTGLHRQDPVQLYCGCDRDGRADRARAAGAGGAAVCRRRVRGGDLRRHHDDARIAARSGRGVDPAAGGWRDRRAVLSNPGASGCPLKAKPKQGLDRGKRDIPPESLLYHDARRGHEAAWGLEAI